jgi:hypothetical protein
MPARTPADQFRITAKLAVAPRGTLSAARIVAAFRVDPLARRPRI